MLTGAAVLAHDGDQHVLLPRGSVVVRGGTVTHVGAGDPPTSAAAGIGDVLHLPGRLVVPGLVNLHAHATTGAHHHLVDGAGEDELDGATYLTTKAPRPGATFTDADPVLAAELTVWELLRHGTTTVLEAGAPPAVASAMAEVCERIGLRCHVGPALSSGRWAADEQGDLHWHEGAPVPDAIAAATAFVDGLDGARTVRGAVAPAQADTCSDELLTAAATLAAEKGVPLTLHAAQNRRELTITRDRHGTTPLRRLGRLGVLRPGTVLAHAVFLDHHPAVAASEPVELDLLAVSGAAVAHCPVHLARRGDALVDLATYRNLGVTVGIGTDTHPRDLIRELGTADLVARVVAGPDAGSTRALIDAVTTVGASALGRPELGRLAVGCPGDLTVVDLRRHPLVRDPVTALVEQGVGTDVEHVVVGGRHVVDRGRVVGLDAARLRDDAHRAATAMWDTAPEWHRRGRTADQLAPPPFPVHTTTEVAHP